MKLLTNTLPGTRYLWWILHIVFGLGDQHNPWCPSIWQQYGCPSLARNSQMFHRQSKTPDGKEAGKEDHNPGTGDVPGELQHGAKGVWRCKRGNKMHGEKSSNCGGLKQFSPLEVSWGHVNLICVQLDNWVYSSSKLWYIGMELNVCSGLLPGMQAHTSTLIPPCLIKFANSELRSNLPSPPPCSSTPPSFLFHEVICSLENHRFHSRTHPDWDK